MLNYGHENQTCPLPLGLLRGMRRVRRFPSQGAARGRQPRCAVREPARVRAHPAAPPRTAEQQEGERRRAEEPDAGRLRRHGVQRELRHELPRLGGRLGHDALRGEGGEGVGDDALALRRERLSLRHGARQDDARPSRMAGARRARGRHERRRRRAGGADAPARRVQKGRGVPDEGRPSRYGRRRGRRRRREGRQGAVDRPRAGTRPVARDRHHGGLPLRIHPLRAEPRPQAALHQPAHARADRPLHRAHARPLREGAGRGPEGVHVHVHGRAVAHEQLAASDAVLRAAVVSRPARRLPRAHGARPADGRAGHHLRERVRHHTEAPLRLLEPGGRPRVAELHGTAHRMGHEARHPLGRTPPRRGGTLFPRAVLRRLLPLPARTERAEHRLPHEHSVHRAVDHGAVRRQRGRAQRQPLRDVRGVRPQPEVAPSGRHASRLPGERGRDHRLAQPPRVGRREHVHELLPLGAVQARADQPHQHDDRPHDHADGQRWRCSIRRRR